MDICHTTADLTAATATRAFQYDTIESRNFDGVPHYLFRCDAYGHGVNGAHVWLPLAEVKADPDLSWWLS